MEYKVKKFFIDRDSLKKFSQGDIFPCEDPERAAFLTEKGYLEAQAKAEPVATSQQEEPQEIPAEPPKKSARSKKKKEG